MPSLINFNSHKKIIQKKLTFKHANTLINFSHISPNKWYKLSKIVRNKIRNIESKYNFNYKLAARKSSKLRKLYKKIM